MNNLLTEIEVYELVGLSGAKLLEMIENEEFPKPIRVDRVDRWKEKDHVYINAYLDHLHQASLDFDFDSGTESTKGKAERESKTNFLKTLPV